ncbi:MarR family winged helix-turn-helix transcriptional regulator [Neorhizobium sp. T786]|uniref:MarR family winged helix-turn-helix transcriptional regulator n=1 Tax=Pseudorhizobium xiangyangii TaxID=2883104 RepID=UPI001D0005CA|nr:MarR family winged helix-turn-helix transcriptional regulator [Neorhizobium xiangyangii]MCB5203175.1 MarR family winged helix-turn-helix transcriptional regulator [Neorhizobium xiangyangii]
METMTEHRVMPKRIRGLRELFERLEVFRELRSEMPMQTASVFLAIAMRQGLLQRDLPDILGLSQSSISRNVHALSANNRHGKPGLGLVIQRVGPLGAKSPVLHLTKAGKAFAARLMAGDATAVR